MRYVQGECVLVKEMVWYRLIHNEWMWYSLL